MSITEDLARRIESQALISARPGQLAELEQIAAEVLALGEPFAELQQLRRWLEAVSLGRATKETHAEIRAYLREWS